jgi:hypothetical protein
MSNYRFSDFRSDTEKLDFAKTCIWIIHSDKIPPHIGISTKNNFFSLKANGKDFGLNTQSVFDSLKSKKIEFILLETKLNLELEYLEKEFNLHKHAIPYQSSCIAPILNLLMINQSFLLVNLINYLETKQLILNSFVVNLKSSYPQIVSYSAIDVANEIEKLQRVERRKS